jgi:tetratricopeptide (TPR) repeat protein
MKATDEGSKIVKDYKEANLAQIKGRNSQVMFGILLADMGLYDQSVKYFERLVANREFLSQVPDDIVARAYNEIGTALDIKGECHKALEFYERAYDLTVNADHQDERTI